MVLVLALTEETVRDNDIKTVRPRPLLPYCPGLTVVAQIFKAIHNAYVAYLANPFTEAVNEQLDYISPPIRSKKFEKTLLEIAQSQNAE